MKLLARLLTVALLLSTLSFAHAQQEPPPSAPDAPHDQLHTMSRQELDAVKVVLAQQRAWNAANIEEYASAYKDSPETLFVADTISHGFDGIVQDLHKNFPTKEAMGNVNYTGLEPHVLDDRFTVLVGRYHLERSKKGGGNAEGVFSMVLEKTEKGWKIVMDHRT